MSKNKPKPIAKKVNGRKSWIKVAKKVHELNKKNKLGWTWSESMRFASQKIYPKYKGLSQSKILVKDIESQFNSEIAISKQPIPKGVTPKPIENCFLALNVPTEDLIEREWWSIADDDIWVNFDDNLPMRFAFDGIIDTGIIKKSQMPNMMEIREDIRKSGIKYGLVIFKVLIQPNKKDDGKPCSYYVLVTLENSSYDQSLKEGEIYGQITETDLTDEQLKMREERKKQRELLKKQSATKKEAKLRDRPKEVEPKTTTKSKSKTDKDTDLEKIKIQKESRETLERILNGLRQDFRDGLITKRQFQQRQQLILEKFEKGGQV